MRGCEGEKRSRGAGSDGEAPADTYLNSLQQVLELRTDERVACVRCVHVQPDVVLSANWTDFAQLIEGTTRCGSKSRGDEEGNETLRFVILRGMRLLIWRHNSGCRQEMRSFIPRSLWPKCSLAAGICDLCPAFAASRSLSSPPAPLPAISHTAISETASPSRRRSGTATGAATTVEQRVSQ